MQQGSIDASSSLAYESLLSQIPPLPPSSCSASSETIRLDSESANSLQQQQQQKIVFLSDSEIPHEEDHRAAAAAAVASKTVTTSAAASVLTPRENSVQTYKLMPIKICLSESDDEGVGAGGGGGGGGGVTAGGKSVGALDDGGYLGDVGIVGVGRSDNSRARTGRRMLMHSQPGYSASSASGGGGDVFLGVPRARQMGGNGRMRRQWSQENMLKAYNAVVNLGVSLRIASTKFKVPESTLRDRLHGRVNINCTRPGPQTFFTAGEEQRIVDHVLFLHRIGYTVLRKHITETANHLLRITSRAARLTIGDNGDATNLDVEDIIDHAKDPLLMHSASNDFVSLASAMEMQTWMSEQTSTTGWKAPSSVVGGVPPASKRCNLPSASWLYSFTHRWPKIKECVSMSSHHRRYVIEEEVTDSNRITYLRALTKVLLKHKLSSDLSRFWLMDEASISCATHPPRLMNCQTQRLQMPYQSEFPHVTLVGAGNAVGSSVPPFLLYRGSQVYKEMVLGAAKGTKFTYSETGYLSPEIFMSWLLRHFTEQANCSPDNPALLFYDAHLLYVTVSVLDEARRKGIVLFPLPPHAGDLGICASFSALNKFRYHFSKSMNLQMCRAPADKVSNLTICPFVCSAYAKAVSAANLKEVWRTTGLEDLVAQILPELPQIYSAPPQPQSQAAANVQQSQQKQQQQQQKQQPQAKRMPRFKVEPPNEVFEDEWDEIVTLAEHSPLMKATAEAEAAAASAVLQDEKNEENRRSDEASASATAEPSIPSSSSAASSSGCSSNDAPLDPLALALAAAEAGVPAAQLDAMNGGSAPAQAPVLQQQLQPADNGPDLADHDGLSREAGLLIDELKRQLLEFDDTVRVEVKASRKRTKHASDAGSSESPPSSVDDNASNPDANSPPIEKSARLVVAADPAPSQAELSQNAVAEAEPPPASNCIVCGCLAPPTCLLVSRTSGRPMVSIPPYTVIEWAQCDYCLGWLHLGSCAEDKNQGQDGSKLFKCGLCRGQECRSVGRLTN